MGEFENNDNDQSRQRVFSKTVRAGKRTYFFDVRTTRSNDYYITLTESKRRYQDGAYIKRKLFLYKEDFNKFVEALNETVEHVKTELLPDYDYDQFSHKGDYVKKDNSESVSTETTESADTKTEEEVTAETETTTEVTGTMEEETETMEATETLDSVEARFDDAEETPKAETTEESSDTVIEHAEEMDSELSFATEETEKKE